ncbi:MULTISPECIES: AbrB/MazE/SpoVT family DNA-binding domain-containing protein [unclassified Paenibacillus]|uniref:AbrB/MazE/SpoVT family DNA-binding domain-containing protein n=1 Tax=unclassified Paenibacillus TaxID=185978 RepID=UPI00362501B2
MDNFISGKMIKEGEVTIQIEIREKLGLQEGDRLNFEVNDDGNSVTVTVSKRKLLKDLFGSFKSEANAKYDMYKSREQMQNEVAKKIMAELEESKEND